MYESHFGFHATPFALNPDPSFYFASQGHVRALAYLQYGVHQREGFIVVTGEIGSGKTTLVRTLLDGLRASDVVAAQISNTQLDSTELLHSICTAYGVAAQGSGKSHLLAALEAHFTALATKGRRALLIVDEAQNLGLRELEELRMLSNFQLGNHALLQSFLVGQPDLRILLRSPALEQLRQRMIAACHLGPLSPDETKAYIRHRLEHVGWTTRPVIEDDAFGRVHAHTLGIPRGINLLCTRVLLGAWLASRDRIDAAAVDEAAAEVRVEAFGEQTALPEADPVTRLAVPVRKLP